jgi:hypothetical protein
MYIYINEEVEIYNGVNFKYFQIGAYSFEIKFNKYKRELIIKTKSLITQELIDFSYIVNEEYFNRILTKKEEIYSSEELNLYLKSPQYVISSSYIRLEINVKEFIALHNLKGINYYVVKCFNSLTRYYPYVLNYYPRLKVKDSSLVKDFISLFNEYHSKESINIIIPNGYTKVYKTINGNNIYRIETVISAFLISFREGINSNEGYLIILNEPNKEIIDNWETIDNQLLIEEECLFIDNRADLAILPYEISRRLSFNIINPEEPDPNSLLYIIKS